MLHSTRSHCYVYIVRSCYFSLLLMKCVVKIIETSNRLEALSLGCSEELTANASLILGPLRRHHAKHLTHLSLASIRDDPDYYNLYELDHFIFNSFIRLSILTLDYEFVSDTLLKALDNGCMQRLVIHIHGWKDYPGTTNRAWQVFVQKKWVTLIISISRLEILLSFLCRNGKITSG